MNEQTTINDYKVVRLDKSNIHELTALDNAVYGKPLPADFYLKKYDTAYTGKQYVGYIAYSQDGIVLAYYGVIPCYIQVGDRVVLAAQSADTMTHPKYNSRGLFTQLSKLTFALCKEEGLELVFGFPNQNSYKPAVTKLNWKETGWMDAFTIPVKALPLAGIANRLPFLKGLYVAYRNLALKKYTLPQAGTESSVVKEGWFGIERSAAYLQYKKYNPTMVLKAGSSVIWVSLRSGFLIGDIALQGSFDDLLTGIKKLAKISGIRKVQFVVSRGTRLHTLFAERFTPSPSFPVLFQPLDTAIAIEQFKFTFADLDVF